MGKFESFLSIQPVSDEPKSVGSVAIVGETMASQSKKRRRENEEIEEQNHIMGSPKRHRHTEPEVIDLTMSSPIAIPTDQRVPKFDNLWSIPAETPERSPSTGFDYGSADEHEVNGHCKLEHDQ